MSRTCPQCKLVSPDDAVRCDCGYDFKERIVRESNLPADRRGTSATKIRLALLLGVLMLVVVFAVSLQHESPPVNQGQSDDQHPTVTPTAPQPPSAPVGSEASTNNRNLLGGLQVGREYDITKEADLREGPGESYAKKINQKASDVLKTIQYMSVDTSVTVKLLQVKDQWAEVQVTQPEWLATHRGWIPKDGIQGGASSAKLSGWIRHTCRVYRGKSTTSKVMGFLAPPASVGVAADGSGWLRLINGPIKVEGTDQFLDNPDFDAGLYIQAANFTTTIPSKWGK